MTRRKSVKMKDEFLDHLATLYCVEYFTEDGLERVGDMTIDDARSLKSVLDHRSGISFVTIERIDGTPTDSLGCEIIT